MNKYVPALIVAKSPLTRDAVTLTLQVPESVAQQFRYRQGQHLPVRATIDGQEVRRTYSICASALKQSLTLGIRVQQPGRFSNYVNDQLAVGDTLEVMPPSGRFYTQIDPTQRKVYAAFVSGSGITPILSIVTTTLESEPDSEFIVFYGNRKRATTMFNEQLWALKNRFPTRLALHFIMSREATEIALYSGRLDAEKVTALSDAFLVQRKPDDIFVCGPNPMIDTTIDALTGCGFARERIHTERFRPLSEDKGFVPKRAPVAPIAGGTRVTVVMDGRSESFRMGADDDYLLDAAHDNGIDLPYSCKAGVCSTCRALLRKGSVEMDNNDALEPWEVDKGFILTCQSRPTTDEIELDYDTT